MKIISREYKGTAGFHDLEPGVTLVSMCEITTEDGKPIVSLSGDIPAEFNEVQTSGDKDLRISQLNNTEDVDKILWLDDPDYEALAFRRLNIATKNIPLYHDEKFVRGWLAMSLRDGELLDVADMPKYPDGTYNWGEIDDIDVKKNMLKYIDGMSTIIRKELMAIESNTQFVAEYLLWYNSTNKRLKYKVK